MQVNDSCKAGRGPIQLHRHMLPITNRVPFHRSKPQTRSNDVRGAVRPTVEMSMLRKLALALVAAASLGAVALTPNVALAHGWHGGGHGWHGGGWHGGGWHGGWHRGWGGPRFVVGGPAYYAYGGCTVRRLVPTPWGPRWRLVNRCY